MIGPGFHAPVRTPVVQVLRSKAFCRRTEKTEGINSRKVTDFTE